MMTATLSPLGLRFNEREMKALILGLFFVNFALGHLPYGDNGLHKSYDDAFVFEDEYTARTLNLQFDCTSEATYSKVVVQNSTSFHAGLGIPNTTSLYSLKPDLYVVGKYLEKSDLYPSVSSKSKIEIPEGYTAYEVNTSVSGLFRPFGEADISGIILAGLKVNVTQPGDVYLVVPPTDEISRVWLSVGTTEIHHSAPGTLTHAQVVEWYDAGDLLDAGEVCEGENSQNGLESSSAPTVTEYENSSCRVFTSFGVIFGSILISFL